MARWSPDSDDFWVGLAIAGSIAIVLELLVRWKLTAVSIDILENCDLNAIKDASKSCWTNVGVTAALLLTVDVAMLQGDSIEPRYDMDDESALLQVQLAYDFFCAIGCFYCIWAVLQCVLFLCYVDPLTNTDAIKFFIANPACIGCPALSIMFAALHTLFALILWILGTSGLANSALFALTSLILVFMMCFDIWDKGSFDPSGRTKKSQEWQWVTEEDVTKWPWFAKKFVKDEKALRVFKRMAAKVNQGKEDGDNIASSSDN
jgi:hypothetical protein